MLPDERLPRPHPTPPHPTPPQECRARGIPIVYDEVAVGMYRLGPASAAAVLGEQPDVAVYGKLISGGYLPIRCRALPRAPPPSPCPELEPSLGRL